VIYTCNGCEKMREERQKNRISIFSLKL
jgi:hypothetical protein